MVIRGRLNRRMMNSVFSTETTKIANPSAKQGNVFLYIHSVHIKNISFKIYLNTQ